MPEPTDIADRPFGTKSSRAGPSRKMKKLSTPAKRTHPLLFLATVLLWVSFSGSALALGPEIDTVAADTPARALKYSILQGFILRLQATELNVSAISESATKSADRILGYDGAVINVPYS